MTIRIQTVSFLLLVSSGLSVGCDNDPGKGKVQATVTEPAAASEEVVPADNQGRKVFTFAAGDSKIEFVGAKVTRKHDGSFGTFNGTITWIDADPTKSNVSVEIDTASLVSDDAKLTNHLKSPDFFDVEKYPKARFVSTRIQSGGEGDATHTVTGNLELHGVTKAITFPATIRGGGNRLEVDAEFAIDRKDFAIVYPGMPDDLIKDAVLIRLVTRAVPKHDNPK